MCGDDLQDLRAKVTWRTYAMLLADATARGEDMSVIVREVLDVWAAKRLHAHMVAARVLRGTGILGECEGESGEREGLTGSDRK